MLRPRKKDFKEKSSLENFWKKIKNLLKKGEEKRKSSKCK